MLFQHQSYFSFSEFTTLDVLWENESHWNQWANNLRSDACGIPQRMDNCSHDGYNVWKQIRWGLKYIHDRYGTVANALSHYYSVRWY